jgi:Protein of unknown function (DUF2846)
MASNLLAEDADMRTGLLMLFVAAFAASAFAQSAVSQTSSNLPQAVAPGCRAFDVNFAVKRHNGEHPFIQPAAGKALVYFIEDDKQFHGLNDPTTRAGLDGKWVGATHGSSYFYFSVEPGEHHLCASWQGKDQQYFSTMLSLNAEAGKSYFFRARDTLFPWNGELLGSPAKVPPMKGLQFRQIKSDEAELLASLYPVATSRPEN